MFLEILGFLLLGTGVGVIVGLIPGLHPNTIFIITLSFLSFLLQMPTQFTLTFIVALSISNTFINFIPSMILGAPEDDGVLSVLPGHRMLLSGEGYEAIFLTVVGGLGVIILTVLTLPLLLILLPNVFSGIISYIHILLIIIFLWMVLTEKGKNKISAISIFFLAGIFGIVSLNNLPSQYSLFPALTGLFGISGLVMSLFTKTNIPEQRIPSNVRGNFLKGSLTGWLAGIFVGLLPGIGSSQAGVLASQILRTKTKDFLIAVGGINTANIFFTFIVFFTLEKTRSGAAFTISQLIPELTFTDLILVIIVGFITAFFSIFLTLRISKLFLKRLRNIPYSLMSKSIILILVFLLMIFSGPLGILIALTGAFIGLSTILLGIRRTHMMGFLMLPTILFYMGISL